MFTAHRRCFDAHVSLLDPPAEKVEIPYEGGTLPGYFFVPAADGRARPTLILNNGSDGPVTGVWPGLGAPALARGYNALVFDGPGQQSMLFERHVPFRPDWEHVITPVVDYLRNGRRSTPAGRPSTASARPATGSRGRSHSSTASPPPSPTRGSTTWPPHGGRTCRRKC